MMDPLTEDDVTSVFRIAGMPVLKMWELVNAYVPFRPTEDRETTQKEARYRAERPSWLVKTEYGLIELSLRKRVVTINWFDTGYKAYDVGEGHPITKDDVTKDENGVDAWTLLKVAEYLTALKRPLHKHWIDQRIQKATQALNQQLAAS